MGQGMPVGIVLMRVFASSQGLVSSCIPQRAAKGQRSCPSPRPPTQRVNPSCPNFPPAQLPLTGPYKYRFNSTKNLKISQRPHPEETLVGPQHQRKSSENQESPLFLHIQPLHPPPGQVPAAAQSTRSARSEPTGLLTQPPRDLRNGKVSEIRDKRAATAI